MSERKPYVISADVEGLMSKWARANNMPTVDHDFYAETQQGITQIIDGVDPTYATEVVSEAELGEGLTELVNTQTAGDLVNMDDVYVDASSMIPLHVTRAVGPDFKSLEGTWPRPGMPAFEDQIETICRRATSGEVTIVDDVVFSGNAIREVADMLATRGIRVSRVLAGIAIGDGREILDKLGIELHSVKEYKSVVDEICERDFVPGAPGSGRSIYTPTGEWYSAPYITPFGDPEGWASIPAEGGHAATLSRFCLERAIEMWRTIEHKSGTTIPHAAVPRPLELKPSTNQSIVEYLSQKRAEI